ncbi:MAG: hypothetical protein HY066_17240 [Betaproteobacteria bacterium]|nr:hypothetical protein [Betaproteobacteria bacterium]
MRKAILKKLAAAAMCLGVAGLLGCVSGSGSDGGGATPPPATAPNLSLSLLDATGAAATSLSIGSPLSAKAILKDGTGTPQANSVITFTSLDPALAVVSQASALTDANGAATVRLDAASVTAVGANYLNATASVGGKSIVASAPFSVGAASVSLALALSLPSISAYGTTSVAATLTVNGQPPPAPMTVQFTSGCASSGKASLPASVQTVNGVATATYTDKGCGATDIIVASVNAVQKSTTVAVASPQAANVQFVGVTPATGLLVLRGTGGAGYSETATVQFKVVDTAGAGMASQSVSFDLTTRTGGILLDNLASGPVTKQTDANGNVSVTVQSGTAPTAVWVTASLGGLASQSNKLAISTGRPAQKFFSLAAEIFNIDGGNVDGVKTNLTVHASDRLGNLVPDGTTINFITEGGQIVSSGSSGVPSSTCQISAGACSVSLVSAAYRPVGDSEPSGKVTRNRVTVLAYTLGEKNFVDANGNNLYDAGEAFDDLGDVYIDNNENGQWNSGEQSISFNAANIQACKLSTGVVDASQKPNTCSGAWGQAHVRQSLVIVFSGNIANTASSTSLTMGTGCSRVFPVVLTDLYNNPMPAGSTLTIGDNTVVDSTAPAKLAATVTVSPATIPNTNAVGGTTHFVTVAVPTCVTPFSGSFNLKVSTPAASSNTTTTIPFTVN